MDLYQIIREFGFNVALILVLIWFAFKLVNIIIQNAKDANVLLAQESERNRVAIENNTKAMTEVTLVINDCKKK